MASLDKIKAVVQQRLSDFLDASFRDHPEAFRSVYAFALGKSSLGDSSYLDLAFSWNYEDVWIEHISRPMNNRLPPEYKFSPDQWAWYENSPHQKYSGCFLYFGDEEEVIPEHIEDRELERDLRREHPDLSQEGIHTLFVREIFTHTVTVFREHRKSQEHGVSDAYALLYMASCPSYGDQYWGITSKWNPKSCNE